MRRAWSALGALLLALSVAGCDSGPRALIAREDTCRYCRMTIDDVRFGAMVMTARGRLETFDSIECLASFVASLPKSAAPKGIWVADFQKPSRWVDVANARFLHQSRLRSPMGRELAAFGPDASPEALQQEFGGQVIDWTAVQSLVQREQFAPAGAHVDSAAAPSHTH